MPLIAAAHIPIVITLGPAVGLGAMAVAAVTSIPFAYLCETGRQSPCTWFGLLGDAGLHGQGEIVVVLPTWHLDAVRQPVRVARIHPSEVLGAGVPSGGGAGEGHEA
jgi:hypothetical protein